MITELLCVDFYIVPSAAPRQVHQDFYDGAVKINDRKNMLNYSFLLFRKKC